MSNKAVLYEFNTVAMASGFSDGQRIREAMLASGNIIGNFFGRGDSLGCKSSPEARPDGTGSFSSACSHRTSCLRG